ncbi:two-component system response regulator RR class II (RRII)-CheY-LuxR [Synechococcus sp. RS9909]|nr:two-component system response regulator RR class II (RRII)-CheY-LuxR [Synechococcus sp. RS9909]
MMQAISATTNPTGATASLRCVVVEDQTMFLQLLVSMLQLQQGLEVVATATTAAEGIAACLQHQPDLLILDLSLPDQGGEVVAEALVEFHPEARLIVLSAQASSFVCPASLQPMLHAVVDKIEAYDCLGAEIAELLRAKAPAPLAKLTRREREVLSGIGAGLSNQQIADRMHLSVHTVETHRRNLSGKLGFKGAELVRYATLQSLQAHA